jgi:hypothetical protein
VLTRATPVLGHAATSRQFDIRDEIELADDCENKPHGEVAALSLSVKTYLEDVESFLGNLSSLQAAGKFDPSTDAFEVAQSTILPCVAANKVGNYTPAVFRLKNEALRPSLEWFSKLLADGYSMADCLPSSRFGGEEAASSSFTYKLDSTQLSIEFGVKKRSAERSRVVSGDLAKAFQLCKSADANIVRSKLLDNTAFRSENDQIFVVTRLPRAGLDSLLAKNAK